MDEVLIFTDRDDLRKWFENNHSISDGIWMTFGKGGKLKTVKYDEALEEALCFGWIDGQFKSVDETKYIQRFTPRRKGSKWSERNKTIAAGLIENGSMTAYGISAIDEAKKSMCWDYPKRDPITDEKTELLKKALVGHEPALSNFIKMSPSVRRTYTAQFLLCKKEETRLKRLGEIIERLNENKRPM